LSYAISSRLSSSDATDIVSTKQTPVRQNSSPASLLVPLCGRRSPRVRGGRVLTSSLDILLPLLKVVALASPRPVFASLRMLIIRYSVSLCFIKFLTVPILFYNFKISLTPFTTLPKKNSYLHLEQALKLRKPLVVLHNVCSRGPQTSGKQRLTTSPLNLNFQDISEHQEQPYTLCQQLQ
jgi:hypothetical protein